MGSLIEELHERSLMGMQWEVRKSRAQVRARARREKHGSCSTCVAFKSIIHLTSKQRFDPEGVNTAFLMVTLIPRLLSGIM